MEELNVKELALAEGDGQLDELATAEDEGGYVVGLDMEITPELADEGLARELVHRIQNLRKSAGFEIMDQIEAYYRGPERLRRAAERHANYVREETLSRSLVWDTFPSEAHQETIRLGGEEVTLAVRKVG